MFIREDFFKKSGYNVIYQRFITTSVYASAEMIELLDDQRALVSSKVYLSTQSYASVFFAHRQIPVDKGTMLIITESSSVVHCPDNLNIVCIENRLSTIFNFLSSALNAPAFDGSIKRFAVLWSEIIKNPNIKNAHIFEALRDIDGLTGPFARICCVYFDKANKTPTPYISVIDQLTQHIPNSCGTVYEHHLIILQTYSERKHSIDFDSNAVSKILKNYDATMIVGNGTRDLTALCEMHKMLSRAMEIVQILNLLPEQRIFPFERVATYLVIDYCSKCLNSQEGANHLLYIAHPGIVALTRHDNENHDNLRDVLYFYLMNNCSVSITADKLYLHRNTVINKIRKIQNIVNVNFESRHIRQRLIFSCQVLRYHEGMQITFGETPSL